MFNNCSGISDAWEKREFFGEILDLHKDLNVGIGEKNTIQTTQDLFDIVNKYVTTSNFDTSKFISFATDGAEISLGNMLESRYNWSAFVIWGLLHQYNLIAKNSLKFNCDRSEARLLFLFPKFQGQFND